MTKILKPYRAFLQHQGGMAAVEFGFILPVLLVILVGSVSVFDLFKADRSTSSAANTVVDLTARQPVMNDTIRDTLFAAGRGLLGKYGNDASYAVTIASIEQVPGVGLRVAWSESNAIGADITDAAIPSLDLPTVPDNESVIYVSVRSRYAPAFGTVMNFSRETVRRPRFVAAIAYETTRS